MMSGSATRLLRTLLLIAIAHQTGASAEGSNSRHPLGDGHGKSFGEGRPSRNVPMSSGLVLGHEFFSKQVKLQEPMVYKGMFSKSPAVHLWTDEYFLNLKAIPKDEMATVEGQKKETRDVVAFDKPFFEFLKEYNTSDIAMVELIPIYLLGDVQIPSALQCPHFYNDAFVDTVIWFSSGGTNSLVHTDPMDYLHCVVAGREKFVFVHPKYKKFVSLDGDSGSYSKVDVDAVDYDKYPGLAEVMFEKAEVEAGDCIYIPLKRINQVRSFDRTIALNFYWDSSANERLESDECHAEFDPKLTLSRANRRDLDVIQFSPVILKADFLETAEAKRLGFDELPVQLGLEFYLSNDFRKSKFFETATKKLKQVFDKVDKDSDGFIEESDVLAMESEDWDIVFTYFKKLSEIFANYEELKSKKEKLSDEL